MNTTLAEPNRITSPFNRHPEDAFSRLDESEDILYYAKDRFVPHLDAVALATVEKIIGELLIEEQSNDTGSYGELGFSSPGQAQAEKVVGLGLNRHELEENKLLSEMVIHDLNQNPLLPFPDAMFDAVINTVSVDYMTKPFEVFREVGKGPQTGRALSRHFFQSHVS